MSAVQTVVTVGANVACTSVYGVMVAVVVVYL